jgi:hypothetical protein
LLPEAMRLPEGVLLLWPVFLALQRLRGRRQGLTFGEWLWVLAWLGTALLTGLSAWERWGEYSQPLGRHKAKRRWFAWERQREQSAARNTLGKDASRHVGRIPLKSQTTRFGRPRRKCA